MSGGNHNLKTYMYLNVHSSNLYNSQDMEATYMPVDRGTDKEDAVHICKEMLLSHKKSKIIPLAVTWMYSVL